MISVPSWLVPGAFVSVLGAGCGRVIDVCRGDSHVLVGLESAKCAARFQPIEWLEYTLDPEQWTPTTVDEVLAEYKHELSLCQRAVAMAVKREQAVSQCIDKLLYNPPILIKDYPNAL